MRLRKSGFSSCTSELNPPIHSLFGCTAGAALMSDNLLCAFIVIRVNGNCRHCNGDGCYFLVDAKTLINVLAASTPFSEAMRTREPFSSTAPTNRCPVEEMFSFAYPHTSQLYRLKSSRVFFQALGARRMPATSPLYPSATRVMIESGV